MIYDDFASQLQREYDLFLFAVAGRYLSLTGTNIEVSPMLVRQLRTVSAGLQATFLEHAKQRLNDFTAQYASASSEARSTAFMRELTRMTDENIKTLTDKLKGGVRDTFAAVKNAHGAMGLLMQKKAAEPEFLIKTKSGRSFKASAYLYTEARDLAYRVWIDNKLEWIAQAGDLAEVQYPDPNHAGNGMVFSISGETKGVPSFNEIEDKVFHYNAQATIVPHVPL